MRVSNVDVTKRPGTDREERETVQVAEEPILLRAASSGRDDLDAVLIHNHGPYAIKLDRTSDGAIHSTVVVAAGADLSFHSSSEHYAIVVKETDDER